MERVGTNRKEASVVIVGGGVAGLACAWALARAGTRGVVLLESEAHTARASSARSAAILRVAGGPWSTRVLARRTAQRLGAPPPDLATAPLLEACGVVLLDDADTPEPGWIEEARREGSRVESLDRAQLATLAPWFHPRPDARAWLLPDEGRIDVPRLVAGLLDGARAAGVEVLTAAPVDALLPDARGVRLVDGRVIEARHTLLAAGAHAAELGRACGSHLALPRALRATRRHLAVTPPDTRIDPAGPVVWDERSDFYARPVVSPADGAAGGWLVCDCDTDDLRNEDVRPDPPTDPTRLAELERASALHLPDTAGTPSVRAWAGVRTLSGDGASLIGLDPDVDGLFWVAGLGGHGMSTSTATGELAASLLRGEPVDPQLSLALSPARFRSAVVR